MKCYLVFLLMILSIKETAMASDWTTVLINKDGRNEVRHLNMVFSFPNYPTRQSWEDRAEYIRKRILTSNGLMPMPEKCPLNVKVTGKIEGEDYTIENVYFESFAGFFVCGNLYRPKGKQAPFPAIANPHGHWSHGRLEHQELGSIPGRCINFAKQGFVSFAYDMIGYNDSKLQVPHTFGGNPKGYLWGISLMGLQLWNSIRVIDFLQSLPDVDPDRIACTGASGGGTQTFMLMSIDKRVKVSSPNVMVSAYMQGGCLCENAPNLRLDCFNVEIASMMAPRPMILVSCTGDWTSHTPEVEYPAVQSIYRMYNAIDKIANTHVDAQHNYNQPSREAVYGWFNKWLLGIGDGSAIKETPFEVPEPETMLNFPDGKLPENAITGEQLVSNLINDAEAQLESLKPKDSATLEAYRDVFGTVYKYALSVKQPQECDLNVELVNEEKKDGYNLKRLIIGRKQVGERMPALMFVPEHPTSAVLVVHPEGKSALADGDSPSELVKGLLAKNKIVLGIDTYKTGETSSLKRDESISHFYTYNISDTALRLQDILNGIAYLLTQTYTVDLIGLEKAGLWCLLTRGVAENVNQTIVDCDQFDYNNDDAWVKDLFIPHIRKAGDFKTSATLIAPAKLCIHNVSVDFPTEWISDVFKVAGASVSLQMQGDLFSDVKSSLHIQSGKMDTQVILNLF
ncbi:TPA: hypothetical protein ENS27_05865 [bacterium]|nr:hypothetical protein [bacterium]